MRAKQSFLRDSAAITPMTEVCVESVNDLDDLDADASRIRSLLEQSKVVLLKGVVLPEFCDKVRDALLKWATGTAEFETGTSAQIEDLNFHRIDDGGRPAHIDHCLHVFGFGTPASLPKPLSGLLMQCAGRLQYVTNCIARTDFQIGEQGLRIMAMHLPRGGGYIAPHQHPYLPNMVASLLVLSRPGDDYVCGGPEFNPPSGWLRLTADMGLAQGDVVLARSDMPHGYAEIDPEAVPSWRSKSGLWALSCEHISSYPGARQLAR